MALETEYIIESSNKQLLNWRELWQHRELFYFFSLRDLKVKYKQTFLGVTWVILQPIITVLIFSLFFGRALRVPSDGLPYPVFVFSGLLLWTVFSVGISTAAGSMVNNAAIIKKIYFPRLIIPVSAILVTCVDFLVSLLVFVALLVFYQVPVDMLKLLLFWPVSVVLTFLATLGFSCWLAALNVKYRDFRYVIPFGLQIALFLSPVIYPVTIVGQTWIKYVLALNPMYGAIVLFRAPLTGVSAGTLEIVVSVFSAMLFFAWGIYYFKKTEVYFADIA